MTILTILTATTKTMNFRDCGYEDRNLHTSEKLMSGKRNGELKGLTFHTAGTIFSFRPRYRLRDIRVVIFLGVSWHKHLETASHLLTTASFVVIHHSRDPETAHSDSRWWLSEGSTIISEEPHRPSAVQFYLHIASQHRNGHKIPGKRYNQFYKYSFLQPMKWKVSR
jgi:hypothetical protein